MTYRTISYDDGERYQRRRPYGSVTLHGPGGPYGISSWHAWALVDTGADYMCLPSQAAHAVGVSLTSAASGPVLTAGGVITVQHFAVDVEIQGVRTNVPVNFAVNAKPLIGRQAIFAVLPAIGFTTSEWLLEWPKPPTPPPQPDLRSTWRLPPRPTAPPPVGFHWEPNVPKHLFLREPAWVAVPDAQPSAPGE